MADSNIPGLALTTEVVMAGLDPAIHVVDAVRSQGVDARHKAGHDELHWLPRDRSAPSWNIIAWKRLPNGDERKRRWPEN